MLTVNEWKLVNEIKMIVIVITFIYHSQRLAGTKCILLSPIHFLVHSHHFLYKMQHSLRMHVTYGDANTEDRGNFASEVFCFLNFHAF